jgi:hypothetical protein
VPRCSHASSLYDLVTSIQWQHNEADSSTRIQGTATTTSDRKDGNELKSFSLDTTRHTEQWIADHLWEMVSPVA